MTIGTGQILDKYELLERVGQGGMAVVYRGLDRSLKRQVAIKVLHRHLADFQEARDRFEREAHAVAKLRHENILEIFDFSGSSSDESYIVTEFIAGPTLRSFIDDYQIKFAEVGAMIAAQICRALVHAHSVGVLHRDVKPENVMIRDDGVIKLTDFGIAQILDNERMTVTGQLLGSPAYMAPEHVEGKKLDFRSDVFAVGVVLYQLVVGSLPFVGKNAHEILKRIAECQYEDPRVASAKVGNELGRIINRALARDPDDRFADISEMLRALESYLAGSSIKDVREELGRFFSAPASYEMALRERLLAHLTARARELMESDRVAALSLCDRVLNIDPEHREVLLIIDRLSRRQRWLHGAVIALGVVLVVAGGFAVYALWPGEPASSEGTGGVAASSTDLAAQPGGTAARRNPAGQRGGRDEPEKATEAGMLASQASDAGIADALPSGATSDGGAGDPAAGHAGAALADARSGAPASTPAHTGPEHPGSPPHGNTGDGPRRTVVDAGAPVPVASARTFTLVAFPHTRSEFRVGDGVWLPTIERRTIIQVPPGTQNIEVRNQRCCQSRSVVIPPDDPGGHDVQISLGFLPAMITPKCTQPGVRVQIDGATARLDRPRTIPISGTVSQLVTVTFIADQTDTQTVKVGYNESRVVTCHFD